MPAPIQSTRFPFTEARIRALPNPPARKKIRYRDDHCPGLALRAMGSSRAFIWYGKAEGHPIEIRLGAWPALTVEDARKKAKAQIAPDPKAAQAEKRDKRTALTLADAWAALLAHPWRRDGKAALRPSSLVAYKAAWDHMKALLGSRLVTEIDAKAVAKLRTIILAKHGPAQTRRALALLVILVGGRMPRDENGRAIGKPSIEPRRRYMDAAELGALLRGLDAEPQLWRVFWLCCLLAPLRRGNIANTRWSDLNLAQPARWIVNSSEAKGGRLLAMPIAEPLAKILRDWRHQNPLQEWVFPAGLTGSPRAGTGPVISVQHAWARALLLGEAVRLCDALGPLEQITGRERFTRFQVEVANLRTDSWRTARDRIPMERDGSPLARSVDALRAKLTAHGIDPAPLALCDLHPHDLRRTAASWAVQSGASLAIVAASLGHADTRVTEAHYGHLSDDPVRRMLADNAGRLLATTITTTPGDNS